MGRRKIYKTVFRQFDDGEIMAIFPTNPGGIEGDLVECYLEGKGKFIFSLDIVLKETKNAKGDTTKLKKEIEDNLKIRVKEYGRLTKNMEKERIKKQKKFN